MSKMAEDLYHAPAIQTPSITKLREIAAKYGLGDMSEEDLKQYQAQMKETLKGYTTMYEYPEPTLPVKYPRTPGYRPSQEENTCNAWYYKTDIKGAAKGKLVGKKIAIKDNIPVAGVPIMNGSSVIEGYTPDFDATVVTRILDAGGHITGKSVCENLCLSGSSETSSTGPVRNPHDPTRSAGGSSGGSAALVLAGYDNGLDPRQPVGIEKAEYTDALTGELSGIHIGLLKEGFEGSEPDVAKIVKEAAMMMETVGAKNEDVSIPMHKDGLALAEPFYVEGIYSNVFQSAGTCVGMKGFHPTPMVTAFKKSFKALAGDLPPSMKSIIMLGEYIQENYGSRHYARAQNTFCLLRDEYNKALTMYDVIILPTIKFKAPKLLGANAPLKELLSNGGNYANAEPFNITGHPALSINAGFSEGLPVGMMIVGKHWHDATVLRVAHAFEQIRDAK